MKRLLDLVVVLLGLTVVLPVSLITAVFVLIYHGKPVLFSQVRPGKDAKPFNMYKFRSMTNATDPNGKLLPNAQRMTKFGAFLRSSSLDELPGLYNVLIGKMSLVGPRPLLMDYLPLYNDFQNKRHEVLPGITGWAQVNGRNAISWDDKFKLDVWYVENRSFWLDIKILFLTFFKVFKREGISHEGDVAMPRFTGSKN
ncbi:sugar transferase [Carboxylicivirga sp. N1Y90]|uniref:sugar transferase n=1 Tax=Carboxylicivirga fragile TaxID=3417571 RepID=UPI003D335E1F|nr:sugar transferase [Marinilabiliaceae bacterium N1Y90]